MNIDLLFRYYYRPLCLYALHYLGSADAAEDVVQDAFLKLHEQLRDGRDIQNAKAWLYTAVRNAAVSLLRRDNPVADVQPADLEGLISDDEAQERSLHEAELWTAIDALPARCREVFLLSKREGLKYREIAQRLGISEKTVEHQVSKALKVLRGRVSDFFYLLFVA